MSLQFPPQVSERALIELFKRRDAGDPNAVARIVEGNLRLVQSIASQFKCDPDDVFQEGSLGLLKAAERFDSAHGSFGVFAYKYIRGSILNHLRAERRAPDPTESIDDQVLDTEPSAHELAELRESSGELRSALETLPYKQRRILELHWGLDGSPQSRRAIGTVFACSESQVRRLEAEAMGSLRAFKAL